jgi:hypothetical protein
VLQRQAHAAGVQCAGSYQEAGAVQG